MYIVPYTLRHYSASERESSSARGSCNFHDYPTRSPRSSLELCNCVDPREPMPPSFSLSLSLGYLRLRLFLLLLSFLTLFLSSVVRETERARRFFISFSRCCCCAPCHYYSIYVFYRLFYYYSARLPTRERH